MLVLLGLIGVCWTSQARAKTEHEVSEEHGAPEVLIEDVRLDVFDCGQRQMSVHAARGVPGRQRIGFLQTALVPTLELEDVTVQRTQANGELETVRVPVATVNWPTKTLSTPNGTRLFRVEGDAHPLTSPHDSPIQFCQS